MSNIENNPKVSILIPTHNRPKYFEIALQSALSQTYSNIEIIISDNSENTQTWTVASRYLGEKKDIYYLRTKETIGLENFYNAYKLATGDYIAYLMDDDIFHAEKVSRMVDCFLGNPTVGLVTSFRQLIDSEGKFLPPVPSTEKLLSTDAVISGKSIGRYMLEHGSNVIGEPTTAMVRRTDIPKGLGWYRGKQYRLLTDVATWLSILEENDCAYLSDPLSYFRLHNGQDQKRSENVRWNASLEWFELLIDAHKNKQFLDDPLRTKKIINAKLDNFKAILKAQASNEEEFMQLNQKIESFKLQLNTY